MMTTQTTKSRARPARGRDLRAGETCAQATFARARPLHPMSPRKPKYKQNTQHTQRKAVSRDTLTTTVYTLGSPLRIQEFSLCPYS
eukprot:4216221-Prymnesium_polylepis.2